MVIDELFLAAAALGKTKVMEACLDEGAEISVTNRKDLFRKAVTALHYTAAAGNEVALELLINRGAQHLIQARDETDDIVFANDLGDTPIHYAAENGHAAAVRVLTECGADPTSLGRRGRTPLHLAADGGHLDVVKLLLNLNANPNLQDAEGNGPLHYAAKNNHQDVAIALIARGASKELRNYQDRVPIQLSGDIEAIKVILRPAKRGWETFR